MVRAILRRHSAVCVLSVSWLLVCLGGCAQTASYQCVHPAQANITGIRSLAVLDVRATYRLGPAATEELLQSLHEGRHFQVVGEGDLQQFASAPLRHQDGGPNLPAAHEAARRMGVDALLVCNLRVKESNGKDYGTVTFRIGNPVVLAVVSYELWDPRAERLIDRNQVVSSSFEGELERSSTASDSETRVLDRLAREGAVNAARQLIPHEVAVNVELASEVWGSAASDIREGNKAAREGNWALAATEWGKALEKEPDNKNALYNLGLAHEATRDFARAAELYEAAAAISDDEMYDEALSRVRVAADDYQVVFAQRASLYSPPSQASYVQLPHGNPDVPATAAIR